MTAPTHRVGEPAWDAWGDPTRAHRLTDDQRALISQVLGVAAATDAPRTPETELRLPRSALSPAARAALAAAVGPAHVNTRPAARLRRAGGKSTPDLLRRRAGDVAGAPDAVVSPADHDQVAAVLAACAEHGVAVVPFGGGTSVVGGVEPLRGDFAAAVCLDLRRLDRLLALDPVARTATLQAGLRTPEAEELLADYGMTLGHRPQSYEYATIGGYAATRSAGQDSAGYGRFDSMVLALRAATPRGTLDLGRAPASAAGPDLRQLLLGSEGVFGVITEVTLRVRPLPAAEHEEAWSVPDFAAGTEALRALAQGGLRPTLVRLSDPVETYVNAALAGGEAPRGCLAVVRCEGDPAHVAAAREAAATALRAVGGTPLGEEPVAHWRAGRYSAPYLRDALLDAGVLAETLETAATWTRLPGLRRAVTDALTAALSGGGAPAPLVLCHISHVYPEGASLYFTVAAAAGPDPLERWRAAKRAAGDAIAAHGGTITHHHAVGTDHRPWLGAEVGDLGVEVLRAVKRALDPAGVLNPGKLIPEAAEPDR
ncbi:FAD-binding oxidoreductase [Streptomonospora nanhaiensis]|uniref:FAD-binding oxidoreductase n=1 Tax=Streptomonospora nanhaiensis TaxID=1323731 RepID=UPI001C38B6D1|nr:FAD-binding oxidoreductase [Streptomonospora nanhaiensis]MBV2366478.1 FAD-binding oxidoreductase [Streptomonospora nanhaiensis]MBX9391401.1 FAD-binding oxidoreductase [Streptomonospora nanhaiensis]